jgi:carbohydrate diacid regulator
VSTKQQKIEIIAKEILQSSPNVVAVAGKMGVSYGSPKKFFPAARRCADTNQITKDEIFKGYWVPFRIDGDNMLVFGLKSKDFPVKEARLISGLIMAQQREFFLKEHLRKMDQARNKFIKELLTGDVSTYTFEQAKQKGDILGVNLRVPEAALLFSIPGLEEKIEKQALRLKPDLRQRFREQKREAFIKKISEGFGYNEQNNIAFIEKDRIVVLKWAGGKVSTKNTIKFFKTRAEYIRNIIRENTKLPTTAGVGQYYPGISGLRKSYIDAKAVLDLGEKMKGSDRTYHLVDLGMFIVFSQLISEHRKAELAQQFLGIILADKDYLQTMRIFLEANMNLTDAAKQLHVHRNTLIYRLEKIKNESGLDPRRFNDAVQIKIGLLLYATDENGGPKDVSQKVEMANPSC